MEYKHQGNISEFMPKDTRMPRRRVYLIMAAIIIASAVICILHMRNTWCRYHHMKEAQSIGLAQSVESLLPRAHIVKLLSGSGSPQDGEALRLRLVRLVEATEYIHYAYILGSGDEGFFIAADSQGARSDNSHPTGPSCEETIEFNRLPFEKGRSVLSRPIEAPCGTWIRSLTPIRDEENGNIIAVLGLSYLESQWMSDIWNRMAVDIVMTVSLFLLILAILRLWHEHIILKEKSHKLATAEALYYSIFEQAPVGIIVQNSKNTVTQSQLSSINPMAGKIIGSSQAASINWTEITHPDDVEGELEQLEPFAKGETDDYSIEKRIIRPDGSLIWVNIKMANFRGNHIDDSMYLCLIEDISARKQAEAALNESERSKSVLLSHLPGMAYRTKYDSEWTAEFVSEGCRALTGYAPENIICNHDISFRDIISAEYHQMLWDEWQRVLPHRKNFRAEFEIVTKSGERKWVLELGQGIYGEDGGVEALEGIVLDISEQKKRDDRIIYLSKHDFLTGLYNRNQLEIESERLSNPKFLPLSVLVCDIDGLRMINDAYGQAEGDKLIAEVAGIIRSCCRQQDVLGRLSGGEFMLLMPNSGSDEAYSQKLNIRKTIESYNRKEKNPLYEINLSIGYGTKENEDQSIEEAVKDAEEYLRRRKLLNQKSSHHAIVASVMAALYAKSQETEEHGHRLALITSMIGERLELDKKDLDDLQLLSMMHDIGKIGVDDIILNKPANLSDEEWVQMKHHPAIGYRIAMSTPQLEHIAEYILHHHERWDGTGYPMGLAGEDIPLLSRILAVADAYDAMTEDRVYRKAMSAEDAMQEIEKNIGSQFDPQIARIFLDSKTEQPPFITT